MILKSPWDGASGAPAQRGVVPRPGSSRFKIPDKSYPSMSQMSHRCPVSMSRPATARRTANIHRTCAYCTINGSPSEGAPGLPWVPLMFLAAAKTRQ